MWGRGLGKNTGYIVGKKLALIRLEQELHANSIQKCMSCILYL